MQPSRRTFLQALGSISFIKLNSTNHNVAGGRNVLFAVSQPAYSENFPNGSVESYAVKPQSGHKELLSRQPLSLAATVPNSLAVAPDGRLLVVASYGGGIYNVFPVSSYGKIGAVSHVLKEIGSSVHPQHQRTSHPHSAVFHPSGKFLLATDLGADRITVFRVADGRIAAACRLDTPPGSGPGELKIDATGSRITVWHELKAGIARYRFDLQTGLLA